jgi:hypothetical protein
MALTKAHTRMIEGSVASVIDFGADPSGTNDSTFAVQSALDTGKNIYFPQGIYRVTNANVNNPCIIDLNGSSIRGDNGSSNYCFRVNSDHVTIQDGFFGSGVENCGIVRVGNTTTYPQYKNFNLFNVYSDLAITNDKGACLLSNTVQPSIYQCTFVHSGAANTSNMAVYVAVPNASDLNNFLNISVTENKFKGYYFALNNFTSGFYSGLLFSNNLVEDCGVGLRTYHAHSCVVSDNVFIKSSDTCYLWQRTIATGNEWRRSQGPAAVLIEAITGQFSNNVIRETTNIGLIVDGGNSPTLVSSNYFFNCGTHGIYINPAFNFGGQVNSLRIESNFVYGCGGSCIFVEADNNIRSLFIKGNHLVGAGQGNATQQPTILLDFKGRFADRTVIKDNIMSESDVVFGVTGNSDYGIYIDSDNISINYWITENYIAADISNPITDTRTGGGGTRMILRNLVSDTALISATRGTGAIAGNYNVVGGTAPDASS